jgi:formylglycine-generating enzyme required for sulfatase activity/N-acetylneuraminic acid mutarotase
MKKNIKYLWAIAVVVPALWGCTQIPGDLGKLKYNDVKQEMVFINGGTFQMGQTGIANATPVHQVTVSSFLIDNTDVTQGDYQAVMNVNPSYFIGDTLLPVEQETWYDAVLYCNARSRSKGLDTVYSFNGISGIAGDGCDSLANLAIDYSKNGYRLPTEAEWEYACRAGSTTRYYWGDVMNRDYCWDTTNSGLGPERVGQKVPNDYRLYDMSGNVWQWCNDWYAIYTSASQADPVGPATGTYRLLRGGSWYSHDYALCAAYRTSNVPGVPPGGKRFFDVGFRCVLAASLLPPALRSPANGAIGQQQPLTLSWQEVINATGYHVQVSTSDSFTTVAFEDTGIVATSTSRTVSGLSGGVTYYWRVIAGNASEKSAWSSVWSFTTAASALQAPTLVAPVNGAVGQSLSPVLSWSTVINATGYHVQVSTSSTFTTIFTQDSTLTSASKTISNLAGGVTYYWRVRAKNSGGVSTWTTSWNFITILSAIPSAPSLGSPANLSTNQSITPTLVWSTVSGASTYHVQVSTSNTFATIFSQDSTLTVDSMKLSGLAASTTYYWRVRAKNASGVSSWTTPWSFTTVPAAVPPVPTLVSPVNVALSQPQILTLVWSPVGGDSTYRVQLSTSSSFATLVIDDSTLTAANRAIGILDPGTTYYWRVCAKNAAGVSAWTSPWSFITGASALTSPVLSSPANGAGGVSRTASLTWSTVTGATGYRVQVARDSLFSAMAMEDSALTVASKTLSVSPVGNTFYWRVRAKNTSSVSAWSAVWRFTTAAALPAPVLSTPANGATGLSLTPTLLWSTVAGATTYHVQVSTNITFATIFTQDSTLTSDSLMLRVLSTSTIYYWRVRAKNAGGVSAWTDALLPPWSFTTISLAAPPVPTLVSPVNGSIGQSRRPMLVWSSVNGATSYHIQVSANPGFTGIVAVDSLLTDTSKTLDSLLAGGALYFWRVRAKNAAGVSAWTSAWNFATTAASVPWVKKTDMPSAIIYRGIAVLNNKIYCIGGYNGSSYVATVEVYDPATDKWATLPNMPTARAPAAATVNNKIYVIGGGDIATVQEYDPNANTWTGKTPMPTVRGPAVAVVGSIIYAIGGYNSITGSLGTNESYNPSSDTWTRLANMTPRNSTPVSAAGGKVYAFGGEYLPSTPYSLVQEYDPSGNAWVTKTALPSARTRAAAATVNGKIYVIGGTNDVIDLAEVELYDPSSDKWTAKTAMPTARSGSGIAVVNGKIYVIGGSSSSNPRLTTVEEYDPLLDP